MAQVRKAGLFLRTLRHMSPLQPLHRMRLRGRLVLERRSALFAALNVRGECPRDDHWPIHFESCDAQVKGAWPDSRDIANLHFSLLGYDVDLRRHGWLDSSLPQLVSFHLHYWDWAWALRDLPSSEARAVFAALLRTWDSRSAFLRGDAWSPYVVSLRSWSWCCQFDSLVRGGPAENAVRQLMWKQLGFVRNHLEKDVGGNHLIKNLKAWLALGIFFGSAKDIHSATHAINQQLSIQVLPDGGHYERAPAYHVQVLADFVDIRNLLAAAHLSHLIPTLSDVIHSMQRFLGAVTGPDGRVALLNDGYPIHEEMMRVIEPKLWPGGSTIFRHSGVARLQSGPWTVFMDIGDPCPDQLPAHAHADTLGCLVFFGKRRLIGEAFTSTYASIDRRAYERSTAGHSTVEIAGRNSTEVWGAFRAGRRARVSDVKFHDGGSTGVSVSANHDGYRHLPGSPMHSREVSVAERGVTVTDLISSDRVTAFAARWHVPPNPRPLDGSAAWILEPSIKLAIRSAYPVRVETKLQAIDFERLTESSVITVQGSDKGTIVVETRITQHLEAS